MVLYRFDLVPPTPAELHFRKYAFFAKESLARTRYLMDAEGTLEQVNKAIAEFTKGASGYYITKTKIPPTDEERAELLAFISNPDPANVDPTW